jgi:hypothetical protein
LSYTVFPYIAPKLATDYSLLKRSSVLLEPALGGGEDDIPAAFGVLRALSWEGSAERVRSLI